MIIGLVLLASYPLAFVAAVICLVNAATLLRRRLHPLRILSHGLVSAGLIGLIGVLGILPSSVWWVFLILPALTVVAVAFACWRLLATEPRTDFTPRQRTLLRRPHPVLQALPVLLVAAVAVIPLLWG